MSRIKRSSSLRKPRTKRHPEGPLWSHISLRHVSVVFILSLLIGFFIISQSVDCAAIWKTYRDHVLSRISRGLELTVNEITITGMRHTTPGDVYKSLGFTQNDPMLLIDLSQSHTNLEQLLWVKRATITRIFPRNIHINLEEREPLALWQHQKKLHLIDTHGDVIRLVDTKPFHNFPHILGKGAPQNAHMIIRELKGFPTLAKHIHACAYIDNRRWDIILHNKIRVQLPEERTREALAHLNQMVKDGYISDESVLKVDLRIHGRTYLQLTPKAFSTQTKRTGAYT
ncbi:MAG: FtsQ-type POTRA domain-containing protein [Alphaproteobacteria bacterium]|nr:MAG: FtsQ-type POTRA domain-containing protein [Alphaproteobacteria bacterium]